MTAALRPKASSTFCQSTACARAIDVEAQIAPITASKQTNRIIVSLWAHALFAPLTFSHRSGCSLSSGRLFALTVFHASFVFDLTGLCGIASGAGVPLVATLFAAVSLLGLRRMWRAEADENEDRQNSEETHAIVLRIFTSTRRH
ncbi:MAG TPA: hypothetical protein VM822_01725 [Pseudolabrys sp.]|nr:hypothetical protein [Pseudolabrys sp.]